MIPIGEAIKAARKHHKKTQADVDLAAGRDGKWAAQLERLEANPTCKTLKDVADAIGTKGWKIYRFAEENGIKVGINLNIPEETLSRK